MNFEEMAIEWANKTPKREMIEWYDSLPDADLPKIHQDSSTLVEDWQGYIIDAKMESLEMESITSYKMVIDMNILRKTLELCIETPELEGTETKDIVKVMELTIILMQKDTYIINQHLERLANEHGINHTMELLAFTLNVIEQGKDGLAQSIERRLSLILAPE